MPSFQYDAEDREGNRSSARIEAASLEEAGEVLRAQGLTVYSIERIEDWGQGESVESWIDSVRTVTPEHLYDESGDRVADLVFGLRENLFYIFVLFAGSVGPVALLIHVGIPDVDLDWMRRIFLLLCFGIAAFLVTFRWRPGLEVRGVSPGLALRWRFFARRWDILVEGKKRGSIRVSLQGQRFGLFDEGGGEVGQTGPTKYVSGPIELQSPAETELARFDWRQEDSTSPVGLGIESGRLDADRTLALGLALVIVRDEAGRAARSGRW